MIIINISNKLGERLKALRKQKRLSRQDLANLIDISQQIIINIETGRTKITSLRGTEFDKMCFHLSCTKDFLLGESDNPIENKNGINLQITSDQDIYNLQLLNSYVEIFPEGFQLLCKLLNKISNKEKRILVKILESFLDDK